PSTADESCKLPEGCQLGSRNSVCKPISARGGQCGETKAAKSPILILVARLPRYTWSLKQMATSGKSSVAGSIALMRLRWASLRILLIGTWLPVKIIGLAIFCSAKDRAEAV